MTPARRSTSTRTLESSEHDSDSDFEQDYSTDHDEYLTTNGDVDYREDQKSTGADFKGKKRADATAFAPTHQSYTKPGQTEPQEHSRSWTDLNISIIIALISPIGNWLTGSDHVKHFCMLLLLIYYLHQLIEVPWQLYHKSRLQSIGPRKHRNDSSGVSVELQQTAELALSELRSLELFYLFLSVLVPFLGAQLIRHIFLAMGVDSLSWFSTTLFVLATGVRPWSHLVKRLHRRMDDLQRTADEPYRKEHSHLVDEQISQIVMRLDALENALQKVKGTVTQIEALQGVCGDLTEALGDIERTVHRHERKTELARVSHNNRLAVLETNMQRLEERNKHDLVTAARFSRFKESHPNTFVKGLVDYWARLCDNLRSALVALLSSLPSYMIMARKPSSSPPLSPSAHHSPSLTPNTTYSFNGTPLETIPEAADSDSDGTYVSDKESSGPLSPRTINAKSKLRKTRSRSRSHSGSRQDPSIVPHFYGAKAVDFVATVASWPYRVAVTALTVVVPDPVQKVFI